jgi:glycosyltransferase involved in cell wall biosynthesis
MMEPSTRWNFATGLMVSTILSFSIDPSPFLRVRAVVTLRLLSYKSVRFWVMSLWTLPNFSAEQGMPGVTTTLLALTLNEINGVKIIMPQIDSGWVDQIIIVDGGSTDGTIEWAKENGYEVYVQKRRGIRHAYLEVLPLVRGDIIVTISPDGNCPPAAIPLVLDKLRDGYDLVIGSRYLGDAKSEDDDIVTAFGNWLFTKTVNVLHGGSFTDAMVIFRAFVKSLVYDLDLHREESYSLPERLFGTVISWEPLMSVRAAKAHLRIAEVAVGEPSRIGGERKLQVLRWGAAYYFQFWRELWFWRPKPKTSAGPGFGSERG